MSRLAPPQTPGSINQKEVKEVGRGPRLGSDSPLSLEVSGVIDLPSQVPQKPPPHQKPSTLQPTATCANAEILQMIWSTETPRLMKGALAGLHE